MAKVRATRHNGRAGKHGVFKAGHNDRSFDTENAEHIDPSRSWMNVYWDMYQGYNIADVNGVRPERKYQFEEIEAAFYRQKFGDSQDAQNERHEKSRHRERIRSIDDIRLDEKTCPEETVYQLGTKDGHEDPALFAQVCAEFFEEFKEKFGSNIQILDWALHMDEATPHIHERHVFFADDGYGFYFPKQEKACEELGFERPNPEKKPGKHNNAKITFDEELRKLYIEIAEKHGVTIEKVPLEGKKHLEKNDFILAKQDEEITEKQATIDELTLKLADVEAMSNEVAKVAYEKACEVVTDAVRDETIKEDVKTVSDYKKDLISADSKVKPEKRKFTEILLNNVITLLKRKLGELAIVTKKKLADPEIRKSSEKEIAEAAKASVLDQLNKHKEEMAQHSSNKPGKKKEECL